MSALRFEVLGPVRAFRGPTELALGPVRQRAVLVVLLLRSGMTCSTAEIVAAVWGHRPPRTCVGLVRTYISRLRRVLGPDVIMSAAAGYRVQVAADDIDAARLECLLATARQARGGARREAPAAEIAAVLSGWEGEPLAGLPGPYAQAQRVRLTALCCEALEETLSAALATGPAAGELSRLRAAVAAHPLREALVGLLMTALHRSGRQAEALAEYRALLKRLGAESAATPGPELSALHDAVLRSDTALLDGRDGAVPGGHRRHAVAGGTGADPLLTGELRTLVDRAAALERDGHYADAESLLHRARAAAAERPEAATQVHAELARVCYRSGHYPEALSCAREALVLADQLADRCTAVAASQVLGDAATALRELDAAEESLHRAHDTAIELAAPHAAALALASRATVATRRGDLAAAFDLHDRAAAALAGADPGTVSVELALRAAETHTAAGDRERAQVLLRSCLELTEYTARLHDTARALSALAGCLPAGSEARLYQARAAAILRRLGAPDMLHDQIGHIGHGEHAGSTERARHIDQIGPATAVTTRPVAGSTVAHA